MAVMAQITGSKNTLRIYTEYNLRNLFGGEKLIYLRKDKKEVSGLSCLPSGYFTIEKKGRFLYFHRRRLWSRCWDEPERCQSNGGSGKKVRGNSQILLFR